MLKILTQFMNINIKIDKKWYQNLKKIGVLKIQTAFK